MLVKLLDNKESINTDYIMSLHIGQVTEEIENPKTKQKENKLLPRYRVVAVMIDHRTVILFDTDDELKAKSEYDRIIQRANKIVKY